MKKIMTKQTHSTAKVKEFVMALRLNLKLSEYPRFSQIISLGSGALSIYKTLSR